MGDQVNEDEMGVACSAHGRDEKWAENLKGRDHSEDPDVDGEILEYMLGK
jgi:hypothetical protein